MPGNQLTHSVSSWHVDSGFGIIAEENKFRAFVPQLIEHDPDLRVNARCISAD
jgi:hypothetical protein